MRRALHRVADIARRAMGVPSLHHRLVTIDDKLDALGKAMRDETAPDPAEARLYRRGQLRLLLDPSSYVDRDVITLGDWEGEQKDFLFDRARAFAGTEAAAFLDVGAYIGLYALRAAASRIFSRIVAFEADRASFAQMQANLFLNGFERAIDARNLAVSDRAGEVNFWESRWHPDGNRGGVGILHEASDQTIRIPCVALDDVVPFSAGFLVLKIDVEGHESSVLGGARRLIRDNRILVQAEGFDEGRSALFERAEELGLRHIHSIHVDHYFVNFPT